MYRIYDSVIQPPTYFKEKALFIFTEHDFNNSDPTMLTVNYRFLHHAIYKILMPKNFKGNTLTNAEISLMYCISKSIPIDLPFMILSHIKIAVNGKDTELPYGMLITLSAEKMGFNFAKLEKDFYVSNEVADYDQTLYNHMKFPDKISLGGVKTKKTLQTPKGNNGKKPKSATPVVETDKITQSSKKAKEVPPPSDQVDEEEEDSSLDRMFDDQQYSKDSLEAGPTTNLGDYETLPSVDLFGGKVEYEEEPTETVDEAHTVPHDPQNRLSLLLLKGWRTE